MQPSTPPSSSDTLFGRQFYPVEDNILTDIGADPFEYQEKGHHQYRPASAMAPPYPAPYDYYPYYQSYRPLSYSYYCPPSLPEPSTSGNKMIHKRNKGQPERKTQLNSENKKTCKTSKKEESGTVVQEESKIVHV